MVGALRKDSRAKRFPGTKGRGSRKSFSSAVFTKSSHQQTSGSIYLSEAIARSPSCQPDRRTAIHLPACRSSAEHSTMRANNLRFMFRETPTLPTLARKYTAWQAMLRRAPTNANRLQARHTLPNQSLVAQAASLIGELQFVFSRDAVPPSNQQRKQTLSRSRSPKRQRYQRW